MSLTPISSRKDRYLDVKKLKEEGKSNKEIAAIYGISTTQISRIIRWGDNEYGLKYYDKREGK